MHSGRAPPGHDRPTGQQHRPDECPHAREYRDGGNMVDERVLPILIAPEPPASAEL
jgi:hypothetical protein